MVDKLKVKQLLRELFDRHGLSVQEVATRVGVTRAAVYAWLNDKDHRVPSNLPTLQGLATFLHLDEQIELLLALEVLVLPGEQEQEAAQ